MTSDNERERESIKVLQECIDLQLKKSRDYQNPLSTVKQADHYPHGINTIFDMCHQKMTRVRSLLEAAEQSSDSPNFESIEDTFKDLVNYASFAVSYLRQRMEGQVPGRNMFNRPVPVEAAKQVANAYFSPVTGNPTSK